MPQIPAFVSSRPDDVIAPQAGDHVAGARGSVSKAFVLGALAGKSRLSGLSELADMTTARLLGRTTAGSGAPEELTAAQVKTLLAIAAGDVSGLGALALLATVGASQIDANAVTTAKIADANVTLAKMANLAQSTIVGRASGAGTGVPTALTATQVKTLLAIAAGDVSGLGALALLATVGASQIDSSAVTTAKIADGNVTLAKMDAAAKKTPITIIFRKSPVEANDAHYLPAAPFGLAFTKWSLAAYDAAGAPVVTTLTVSFRAKSGGVPASEDELGSASLSAASLATSSSPSWTALTAGHQIAAVVSALTGTAPAILVLQLEGTRS